MIHAPQQYQRRSIRLKDYDYSQEGAYFVTICTHKKALFLENEHISAIVEKCWLAIPVHFPNVQLDEWVIMPNHMHGILIITDKCKDATYFTTSIFNVRRGEVTSPTQKGAATAPLQKHTLGQVIAYFKYQTVKSINQTHKTPGNRIWQRNYYEHVIRNEDDLNEIRQYILDNPAQWDMDENNPTRQLPEPPYDNMVGARHAVPTAVRRQGCQPK